MGPLYRTKRFQDTIQFDSTFFDSSDKSVSIFLTVITGRDDNATPETGSGKGTRSGNSRFLFPTIFVPRKNGKLRPVIDLSLLNQYIKKQPLKTETVKSVQHSILVNSWAVSIDLTDAYLHVRFILDPGNTFVS